MMAFFMQMERRDEEFRAQQLVLQERRDRIDQAMLAVLAKLLDK